MAVKSSNVSSLHPTVLAVLTGDIVKSSSMTPERLEAVRAVVLGAAAFLETWETGCVIGKPEFFRGDSWQMALNSPRLFLRASLFVRARLISSGSDSRVATGLGNDSTIDPDRISLSSGAAFTMSGHALDSMKDRRMVLDLPSGTAQGFAAVAVRLCDVIVSGWTARQAELFALAIESNKSSYSAIGNRLNDHISIQSVGKILRAAHFDVLNETLDSFESSAWWKEIEIRR